jgi:hypothetical protein
MGTGEAESQAVFFDFRLGEGRRFARCANAHLSDDETVAKMGHPSFVVV